jgi:hypothetical protein
MHGLSHCTCIICHLVFSQRRRGPSEILRGNGYIYYLDYDDEPWNPSNEKQIICIL